MKWDGVRNGGAMLGIGHTSYSSSCIGGGMGCNRGWHEVGWGEERGCYTGYRAFFIFLILYRGWHGV